MILFVNLINLTFTAECNIIISYKAENASWTHWYPMVFSYNKNVGFDSDSEEGLLSSPKPKYYILYRTIQTISFSLIEKVLLF